MKPLGPGRSKPGRPRHEGERYPCGKLKSGGRHRPRAGAARSCTKQDEAVKRALSMLGPLGDRWQSYPAEPQVLAAARLLAEHGRACLAQRRTPQGTEYLIKAKR